MQWKDGSRYIGGWKKDKAKGFGIMIDKSGESYYGEWQRGKVRHIHISRLFSFHPHDAIYLRSIRHTWFFLPH